MNFFILAAGEATRWNGGSPKQLLEIEGEPLINRTIRQFSKHGPVNVVTKNEDIARKSGGATIVYPSKASSTAATLLSTSHLWVNRTVILLGDVYYTDDAVRKIVESSSPIVFFTDYHDIFALAFGGDYYELVREACLKADSGASVDGGRIWQVYHNLSGYPIWPPPIDDRLPFLTPIRDRTQDFDIFENYNDFLNGNFKNRILKEGYGPKPAIFIRTYEKDFPWLSLALKSIAKNVSGYSEIVVACPEPAKLKHLTAERVVGIMDLPNGYIGQQLTKMQAYKYTDSEFITFWDSDVIATEPMVLRELFKGNKPIIWKTKYSSLPPDAQRWRGVVDKAIQYNPAYEFMRRLPLTYHRSTLEHCSKAIETIHGKSLRDYLSGVDTFTEFNVLGTWAYYNDTPGDNDYVFIDTEENPPPPNKASQYWSWHGIDNPLPSGKTPRQEIEEILK